MTYIWLRNSQPSAKCIVKEWIYDIFYRGLVNGTERVVCSRSTRAEGLRKQLGLAFRVIRIEQ
jgi:hypothetical protein